MVAENEREPIAVNQTEAARMLGVTERTLRRWDKDGVIVGTRPTRKKTGVKLYPFALLKSLVEGQHRGESR